MADVKKIIEIDVETLRAQGGLDTFIGSLKETETQSISLKSQLRQLKEQLASLPEGTAEYNRVAQEAGNLSDKIGDINTKVKNLGSDTKGIDTVVQGAQTLSGAFTIASSASALLGVENEDLQQTMLKVESAIGLTVGIQSVANALQKESALMTGLNNLATKSTVALEEQTFLQKTKNVAITAVQTTVTGIATAAQWLWNAAMSANPLGVIIIAVTALIAAGYALVKMFQASSDEAEAAAVANTKLNNELKNLAKNTAKSNEEMENANNKSLAMAKANGESSESIRKLSERLVNQEIIQKRVNAETAYAIYLEARRVALSSGATEAELKTYEEAKKFYLATNDALKSSLKKRVDIINDNEVEVAQERTNANKKAAEEQQKANEKAIEDKKKLQEDANKKARDQRQSAHDKELEDLKKLEDEKRALFEKNIKDALDLEKSLNESIETPAQKELREYLEKKKILQDNYLSTEILDKQHKDFLSKQSDDYFASEAEKAIKTAADKKAADEKVAADKLTTEKNIKDALISLSESTNTTLDSLEALGLKKSKATEGIRKGIALAQIATDSAMALSRALPMALEAGKAAAAVAGPSAPIVGPLVIATSLIGSAATIAKNVVNAKKLLSGGSASSAGGGGGGGSVSGSAPSTSQAPQFNIVGNAGVNQIAQTLGQPQPPIQAYVVAGQVTTAQGLNRNIINNATL